MNKQDLKEVKKNSVGNGLLIENDGYISLTEGKNKMIKEAHDTAEGWYCPYPFRIKCILQKCNIKNANGRIYPRDILEREINNYQKLILEHRALGELNHPVESTIDLGRISHNIVELHWEGNTVVGELELNVSQGFVREGVVSTCGDHAANLLLNGYKIGISSRAVGSVENKNGVLIVGDDLELLCWDIVASPSTNNAWLSNDKQELAQYIESKENKGSILSEKINKLKSIL